MKITRFINVISVVLFCLVNSAAIYAGEIKQAALKPQVLIKNVNVWDGKRDSVQTGMNVLVEGNFIKSVSEDAAPARTDATIIDAGGRTLMPGLIDMHSHLGNVRGIAEMRDTYDAWAGGAMASEVMINKYLLKGFTTVRDAGSATTGLARAVRNNVITGPRIYSSGAWISQTAGHGDTNHVTAPIGHVSAFERNEQVYIVDGVPDVLRAVRTNLRKGAAQIKVMANGGVASDYDPLEAYQFTIEELKAAVDAASDYGTYVMVHTYSDESVNRALDAGVKCIEHGFLMTEDTVKRMAKEGAVLSWQAYASLETFKNPEQVPGFGPVQIAKAQQVNENARKVPVWLKKYGVKTVGGADLYTWNTIDFLMDDIVIKQEWYTPAEVLRMHTSTAGEVLAMSGPMNPYREGKLGVIEPGAYADVILWDGNPLEELEILKQGQLLRLVMKDGTIYKNTLAK
jgi:imidazolonepropionase-like amidohydrolase